MLSATIQDGNPRTVTYVEDAGGQVIRRRETAGTGAASTGTILSDNRWYRFAGAELYESGSATVGADGIASAAYTIRDGDSLQSIALSLWGDGALWYKLAEANPGVTGITGPAAALTAGRTLVIPGGVTSTHHSADTFKPYDITEALGNTQPGAPVQPVGPAPPSKKGCGVIGQILLVAIAIAVTIATHGAAAGFVGSLGLTGTAAGIATGVLTAVAGSVVSQGFGVLTGLQDKFSFKSVALAAIGGGVGGGLGALGKATGALGKVGTFLGKSNFISGAARGALSNVLTQGVSIAAGLQKKFDWVGVAVGGAVGGVVGVANRALAANGIGVRADAINDATVRNAGFYANQALSGMAGAVAGGAARSLITGTDFGDNVLAALPDVVGATIGNMAGDGLRGRSFSPRPSAPTEAQGQLMVQAERAKYWQASMRPGAMGGVSTVQYNDRIVGRSGNSGTTDAVLSDVDTSPGTGGPSTTTWSDTGDIIVSGYPNRENTGQSIYQTITNAASGAYNYKIGGISARDFVDLTVNNFQSVTNLATSGISSGYNTYIRPAFRPVADFSNQFDPINRGLESAGLTNAAAAYRGLKFAPARALVGTVEGVGAIDGAMVRGAGNFAYNLKADPKSAMRSALYAPASAAVKLVEVGFVAGMKLPGLVQGAYSDMTSGVPVRTERGYSTAGQAATYLIPQGAALRMAGLEARMAGAAPRAVVAAERGGGHLAAGVADEAAWLAEIGAPKNTALWRPSAADIDSAAFNVIVGPTKYTAGGKPVGTIFDVTKGGFKEFKSGSSMLDSSYQLRLQTYRSLKTDTPFSIVTTRPVNPTFQQWLDRWGVTVAPK